MRVLVCGGRNYEDEDRAFAILDEIQPTTIIEGGAKGADTLGWLWSKRRLKKLSERYDARWDKHGRAAGPMRNQQMLDEGKPDLVVAFPGGRGTADMVKRAKKAGVEVREIK